MAAEAAGETSLLLESAFHAFNLAVTAWHLVDWVWEASDENGRRYLSEFFGGVEINRKAHLFDAVAIKHRSIHICGQIANVSKHRSMWNEDPSVEAMVLWVRQDALSQSGWGHAFQRELAIRDGDSDPRPAVDVFKEAVRARDGMLGNWGFIKRRLVGPDIDPPPWA